MEINTQDKTITSEFIKSGWYVLKLKNLVPKA
jgi:hypothetical protein